MEWGSSSLPPKPDGTEGSLIVDYAGFWRRAGALAVDGVVVIFLMSPVVYLAVFFPTVAVGDLLYGVGKFFQGATVWLYFALMESSRLQGTVGKMLFGMRVTDLKGRRISFARAGGRTVSKILSALTVGIGFAMAGFTQRKQALHDVMAGCVVVRDGDPEPPR